MEQQIKREVATQTAAAGKAAAPRKRDVAAAPKKAGLTTQDLILIAVLLAAGAVLKLTVGSLLSSMGMKPNFIIAMYCLAIILTRPKLGQALIIGLLAGLICQIPLLNATPLLNIPSEILGALACGLLIKVPMSIGGKLDLNPLVNTFVSTVVSGGTFALLSVYINVVSTGGDVMVALATYAAIVLGTATYNCIPVQVLAMPLTKGLKRNGGGGSAGPRPAEPADAAAGRGARSRGEAEDSRTEVRFALALPTISGTTTALADLPAPTCDSTKKDDFP